MSRLHAFTIVCLLALPALGRADDPDPNPDVPASLWQHSDYVLIKVTAYPADAEAVSFDLHACSHGILRARR